MTSLLINRRNFIKASASAAALLSIPSLGFGQTTRIRMEWQQFKTTPQYTSFLNAVRTMKANTNAASPSSWAYWTNVHVNYCPHGIAYFLAWHRGYLYYFEQQLRTVSGDSSLTLPYWNYYKYPRIPAEFTDPANKPLYVPRAGTNVYNALTLAPFASSVWNFQRGTTNAFEPQFESAPHNPVHNLIGNVMATMQSPNDPIFYLHHANVDRLWHAWALPDGKGIPYTSNPYNAATSSPYWAGSFTYSSTLSMPRYRNYYPGWLSYDYADKTKPTSLPPSALAEPSSPIKFVQAQVAPVLTRPATGNFPATAARAVSATSQSLGGVSAVQLNEASVSAQLPLTASARQLLQTAVSAAVSSPAQLSARTVQSVRLVLDDLRLLGAGANGGYFYNIYLNLPPTGDAGNAQRYFVGTVGPFEIAGASHHGAATLAFPATEVLARLSASELQDVTVSFVRVNGETPARGPVVSMGEVRIEVSTEEAWDPSPPPRLPGQCYC
ncbi:MAG TPA: tyrosinase family protein [Noviherbaspirillum sp.]